MDIQTIIDTYIDTKECDIIDHTMCYFDNGITILIDDTELNICMFSKMYQGDYPVSDYYNALNILKFISFSVERFDLYPQIEFDGECYRVGFLHLGFQAVEEKQEYFKLLSYAYEAVEVNWELVEQEYLIWVDTLEELKDYIFCCSSEYLEKNDWRLTKVSNNQMFAHDVYVNSNNTMMFDISKKNFQNYISMMKGTVKNIDKMYDGIDLCFFESQCRKVCIDKLLIDSAKGVFTELGIAYSEIVYKVVLREKEAPFIVCVASDEIWIVIAPVICDIDKVVSQEKDILINKLEQISEFVDHDFFAKQYDISKLSESDFENMCRDLLVEMGFDNVQLRGKTNVADGGVDIECDEEFATLLETEKRHWIYQCKHTKKQIDRKDIAEIPYLIKEFKADGYGLFYSNVFSPQTLDRIKNLESCKVKCFDINQIYDILKRHEVVRKKYFAR